MAKKRTTNGRVSRREALRLAGAAGAAALVGREMLEEPAAAQEIASAAPHVSGGTSMHGPGPQSFQHVADSCDSQWHNPACGGTRGTWSGTCKLQNGTCTCSHT